MPPDKIRRLYDFIVFVNYYRYMWDIWSHLLQPLTALTSEKVAFKLIYLEKKEFYGLKRVVAWNNLLAYPYFNKLLDIHTDDSDHQFDATISQGEKPIAFYSRKWTEAQTQYTLT